MHRALAEVVTQPQTQGASPCAGRVQQEPCDLLEALDGAAKAASARGAPAAAAELLDLAIKLGGDTVSRRIRSAGHHLRPVTPTGPRPCSSPLSTRWRRVRSGRSR